MGRAESCHAVLQVSVTNQIDLAAILSGTECQLTAANCALVARRCSVLATGKDLVFHLAVRLAL